MQQSQGISIWQLLAPRTGHFDQLDGLMSLLQRLAVGGLGTGAGGPPERQLAFTVAIVALGAKMAKADGVVTTDEVTAFERMFSVPPAEQGNARRLFDLAKRDTAGFESYARQIESLLKVDRVLLQHVLEGLFYIAAADGVLHAREEEFLKKVAQIFRFSESAFRRTRARFVSGDEANPYDVLLLDPAVSDAELKTQYRRLVVENHPDKVIARGVPPELVDFATRKVAAINAAYETIVRERGL